MPVGLVLAIVCIVVSAVFAITTNQIASPLWWALLAIFFVLFFGVKSPWP
jgi:chromate transport protein ChrA